MFPEFNPSNYEMYMFAYKSKPTSTIFKYKCLDFRQIENETFLQTLEFCRREKITHLINITGGSFEEKLELARSYKICLIDSKIYKHISNL